MRTRIWRRVETWESIPTSVVRVSLTRGQSSQGQQGQSVSNDPGQGSDRVRPFFFFWKSDVLGSEG
jgi:hypothetical protein